MHFFLSITIIFYNTLKRLPIYIGTPLAYRERRTLKLFSSTFSRSLERVGLMQAEKRKVFTGGDIVTLWNDMPRAEAVCVYGGKIEAVGSLEDVKRFATTGQTEVIDLSGGVLYPGFIDTHSHLSSYANCVNQVYCGGDAASATSVLAALSERAADSTGEWILGYGYDDSINGQSGHLSRRDLDAVSADRPVFVSHISLHFAYANTRALQLLGLSADTALPGGEVVLDESGSPTGLLTETVAFDAFGKLPTAGPEAAVENLAKAVAVYNRQGFTTVMDGGLGFNGSPYPSFQAYMHLAREGRLNARAYLQMTPTVMDELIPFGLWEFPGEHVSFGGAKCFSDGSIQVFTAALLEDYHTRPGYRGAMLLPEIDLCELVTRYHSQGLQVAVHANGDRAIEATLRAFEQAQKEHPRKEPRHIMVHAQLASRDQLERMSRVGVLPTFFVRHVEVWGDRHMRLFLGPERARRLDPAGECVRLGMPFSLHVDTPVLPPTALGSIHAAVNRVSSGGRLLGPEQRVSPLEALKAYTVYASLFCRGENDRGCIAPGRYADFVLLSDDIERAAPESIKDIGVRMTICGGRVVYKE